MHTLNTYSCPTPIDSQFFSAKPAGEGGLAIGEQTSMAAILPAPELYTPLPEI